MKTKNSLQPGFSGVITGASTGVGRSLAILLATDYQAKLVINARTAKTLGLAVPQSMQVEADELIE